MVTNSTLQTMANNKLSFGYLVNENGEVNKDIVAIYDHRLNTKLTMDVQAGLDIAKKMMAFYDLDKINELTDNQLFNILKERGFKGTLEKKVDIN